MPELRNIPTCYKGNEFRSRLEARWAVFWDILGVEYRYEFEGFELPSGWYIPDFWLPDLACWVEVKPRRQAVKNMPQVEQKAAELAWFEQVPVVIAYDFGLSKFSDDWPEGQCPYYHPKISLVTWYHNYEGCPDFLYADAHFRFEYNIPWKGEGNPCRDLSMWSINAAGSFVLQRYGFCFPGIILDDPILNAIDKALKFKFW